MSPYQSSYPSANPALRQAVAQALQRFAIAWPGSRRDGTAADVVDVYADVLDGVTLEAIPEAGRRLIRDAQYFPSPREMRAAIVQVEREHRAARMATYTPAPRDPDVCPMCRTRYGSAYVAKHDGSSDGRLYCACGAESAQWCVDHSPPWEEMEDRWHKLRPDLQEQTQRRRTRERLAQLTGVAEPIGNIVAGVAANLAGGLTPEPPDPRRVPVPDDEPNDDGPPVWEGPRPWED